MNKRSFIGSDKNVNKEKKTILAEISNNYIKNVVNHLKVNLYSNFKVFFSSYFSEKYSLLIRTSFIGQIALVLGEGMGGIVYLSSYKHHFIRVHENLVQHSINT